MRMMGSSGVWELFVPDLGPETLYKFEMLTRDGALRIKTDPFAAKLEQGLATRPVVPDAHFPSSLWLQVADV